MLRFDSADAPWEPCYNWDLRGRFDAQAADNLTAGADRGRFSKRTERRGIVDLEIEENNGNK